MLYIYIYMEKKWCYKTKLILAVVIEITWVVWSILVDRKSKQLIYY